MFSIILLSVIFLLFVVNTMCLKEKPGDPPDISGKLPLIGHAYLLLGGRSRFFKTLTRFADESVQKGGVVCGYIGNIKFYCLTDPEDSLTVANECVDKPYVYKFLKSIVGNGMVVSNEYTWKRHRKLLQPAFNQSVLNGFIPTFNSQARILVDQFLQEVGKPFDHEGLLRLVNLETICLTAIGIDGKELRDLQKCYIDILNQLLIICCERLARVWLHVDFIFNWSTLKKKEDEHVKSFLKFSNKILQLKMNKINLMDTNKVNSNKLKPFLELILELANKTGLLSDEEIRDEINNIVTAGHDTTASIFTFLMTILGSELEVQRKLYEEVTDIFGDTDRDLDKEDLSKLAYTEAVIKETVRLYGIAPFFGRDINKPVKLKNYTLEPNSFCIICATSIHRNAVWGPDADQFKPERWLDSGSLPNLDYFGGFGLGKRNCIGKVYAMMSMKITIAHVIRRYSITSDITKMVTRWDIMSRPDRGHFITLKLRQ